MPRPALLLPSIAFLVACGPIGSEGAAPVAPTSQNPPTMPDPSDTPEPMTPSDENPDVTPPNTLTGTLPPPAVEGSGADCEVPMLFEYPALPDIEALPDPFLSMVGTRITRRAQWACRRAEIAAQVQQYSLGPKPARPAGVSGEATSGGIRVTVEHEGQSISFDATITYPSTGTAPYPAMIGMGGSSLDNQALANLGVAIVDFPNNDVAEQQSGSSRGRGKFYTLYGANHAAGAMMAWAWGVSRLIDALEQTPGANIDVARLGVTGCSRNGKGALVAGAFDERIALTIPQESGAGGSSLWRIADWARAEWVASGSPAGGDIQTLRQIVNENVWFTNTFRQFSESVNKLPFDQHLVMGLVAPRALFVVDNTWMVWLGQLSSHGGAVAAHTIWEALGIPDKMGASQVGDSTHCTNVPAQQTAEINAYVRKFLLGDTDASLDTNVLYTDGNTQMDRARWMPWDVPALGE